MKEFDAKLLCIEYLENIIPEIKQDKLNSLSDIQFSAQYRLSKEIAVNLVKVFFSPNRTKPILL